MARWIRLREPTDGGTGPQLRCIEHAVEFSPPSSCEHCRPEDADREDEKVYGDLPYLPGMPTPLEDERKFREMAAWFYKKARSNGGAQRGQNNDNRFAARQKYAELAVRTLKIAADMAAQREANYLAEKRQAEILRADHKARRALRQ